MREPNPYATMTDPDAPGPLPSALVLRAFDGAAVTCVPLPSEGSVTVGRSSGADVVIDAHSVSRLHARLHVGRTLQIEDLGSSNGTQVGGAALAPGERVDVLPGEEFLLGKVFCVVQGAPRVAPPPRLRSLRRHEYFEARLDDECAMARATHGPFALLRLRVEAADARFEDALMAAARASDVVAWYGPGEYELLRPGAADAAACGDELAAALRAAGWEARVAAVGFPRDGRTPDALIAAASDALRPAAPAEPARAADDIVVEDPAMRALHKLVARFAASDISVLLLGETGTGKEVVAARLHQLSPRAVGPFCKLNCAAFTETLVESELFGHERGAFTGADRAQAGLLESAQGGTVFLDEVGELPLSLQAKLLRVLEDRKVRRVGGREERLLDVRFISATNRDLEREVEAGRFRSDLYHRLNGFPIEIPALRERVGEVDALARRFLALGAVHARRAAPALSPAALAVLQDHLWPGNIRELRNVIDRVLVIADGDVVTPEHLRLASSKLRPRAPAPSPRAAEPAAELTLDTVRPLAAVLDELEKRYVRDVLSLCLNNQTRAADLLEVSRGKLVGLIEKHGLPRPRAG